MGEVILSMEASHEGNLSVETLLAMSLSTVGMLAAQT
jgi:hypothetical protein